MHKMRDHRTEKIYSNARTSSPSAMQCTEHQENVIRMQGGFESRVSIQGRQSMRSLCQVFGWKIYLKRFDALHPLGTRMIFPVTLSVRKMHCASSTPHIYVFLIFLESDEWAQSRDGSGLWILITNLGIETILGLFVSWAWCIFEYKVLVVV